MAGESNPNKRVFPADIFAEDNDKWSWSTPSCGRNNAGAINQSVLKKLTDASESSNSSVEESNNAQILERSFRKRMNSNSEGNPAEDASSSSGPGTFPPERVLPSMYDDDARSASPSAYEKKDLAYASGFLKEFNPLPPKNLETGSFMTFGSKSSEPKTMDKEERSHSSKEMSPSPGTSSKNESKRNDQSWSRSPSRDGRSQRGRSRSRSRGQPGRSPGRDQRRSRERYPPSLSRGRRSHSKEGGQSSSRSRDCRRSRSRSKDSRRRSRSRGREHRRSRSRSRDYRRSRSRSYERRRGYHRSSSRDYYKHRRYSRSRSRSRDRSKKRAGGAMTPQMALQQTMAAMSAKAEALTGVSFPKYYNPAAVNPLKYAEQVQKRKLLWQKDTVKVEEPSKNTVWDKLQFAQDQDGKMTAKFRKLMGIKSEGAAPVEEKESVLKKQEELFRDLDQQYEMARMTTHTQRGVGLGYTAPPAAALYPPVQK